MKLTVRCPTGLRIDFEGSIDELERFDGFLGELARLERDRLAPRAPEGPAHVVVLPDPSPPSDPAPAAEPDASPAPDTVPPPARASAGGRDGLTGKQQALLSAVNTLGEASLAQVCEYVGRTGEGAAVGDALKHLRDRDLIGHNGKLAKAARWQRIEPLGSQRQRVHDTLREAAKPSGLSGSVEERVRLALKWAKRPMSLDGLVSRCQADGERSQVQEALAYMEAEGQAVCDDRGLWSKVETEEAQAA